MTTTCPLGHDTIGDNKVDNAKRHCNLESHLTVASIMSIPLGDFNRVALATFYCDFVLSKCFIGSRADEFYVHIARRRNKRDFGYFVRDAENDTVFDIEGIHITRKCNTKELLLGTIIHELIHKTLWDRQIWTSAHLENDWINEVLRVRAILDPACPRICDEHQL